MNQEFRLTEPAIKDIEEIADYIAKQSGLRESELFLSKLDAKFFKIAQFPRALEDNEMKYYLVSVVCP